MEQIKNGKIYDTKKADLIASDRYWDQSNFHRGGRNKYLYKTKKGNYFLHLETNWQGELDEIETITQQEAVQQYEQLQVKEVEFKEAFPGVELVEA